MNNRSTLKRLAASVAAGGVVALAPVAMPAANAAPAECPTYSVQATTDTTLSVSPANPTVGDAFTATATVLTSGGVPVNGGVVNFSYAGQTASDVVQNGTATATFTAEEGRFTLSAAFEGQCLAGGSSIDPSTDTQAIVAGVEASAGGNGSNGGAARPGTSIGGVTGSGGTTGGLASTGVDTQTELFGLLGVGLVTVGGLTLMVHRRRVQG